MKFFDDKNKKLSWWTRNYFFLGTVLFIALNISIFAILGNSWEDAFGGISGVWGQPFQFGNLIRAIFNTISHSDWEHVLFNMLFFAVTAIYIERKMGTFNFILFILGVMVFDASITTATDMALNWHGWSGVCYATKFYVFIDYIFSFQKQKRNKFNIILGAIICFICYASMSASINDGGLVIYGYPHGLIYNAGHYSAALAGVILGLVVQISQLKIIKQMQPVEFIREKLSTAMKIVYICVAVLIAGLSVGTTVVAVKASQRSDITCSLTFDCNIDTFDKKFEKNFKDVRYSSFEQFRWEWVDTLEESEKAKYGYELYLDKEYKEIFTKEYGSGVFEISNSLYNQPWGRGEFVPLATEIDQTIYVRMFEICTICFNDFYDYTNNESFPDILEKEGLFSAYEYYTEYMAVEKGSSLRFKIPNPKYSEINLYIAGDKIEQDEEGYYLIENITDDIQVDFVL